MRGILFCLNLLLAVFQPTFTFAEYAIQPSYVAHYSSAKATIQNNDPHENFFLQHELFEVTDDDDSDDKERKALSSHSANPLLGYILQPYITELSVFKSIAQNRYVHPIALFILLSVFRI